MTRNALGVNPDYPTDIAFARLGQVTWGEDDSAYIYVQADGAIAATDAVIVDEDGQAVKASTTSSASAFGDRVGVANAAMSDDQYGWVQVYGPTTLNVAASCAANAEINTTGTGGRLDDDGSAGAEKIVGIVTTGSESSNAAAAMLIWPYVGATI